MDIVGRRVCIVENPEAVSEPPKLRIVAHWLLEFGMRVGTIPDQNREEVNHG